jgi:hypothetical protein
MFANDLVPSMYGLGHAVSKDTTLLAQPLRSKRLSITKLASRKPTRTEYRCEYGRTHILGDLPNRMKIAILIDLSESFRFT